MSRGDIFLGFIEFIFRFLGGVFFITYFVVCCYFFRIYRRDVFYVLAERGVRSVV